MASGETRRADQEAFLASLASGEGTIPARNVAVVVAHPDDETLGIGGQLPRLAGATIVHVTDGAPRDMGDARSHGFATREAYAAARRRELEAVVALAGVPAGALVSLGLPDQDAATNLVPLARRLAALCAERGIKVAVTHAYEGGHPDHDATAFAVHAARDLLGGRLGVVEMPFYHVGPEGWARQAFLPEPALPHLSVPLAEAERALKRRMFDAFASQRETLKTFSPDVERFRAAPAYDFAVLPNGGDLLYERYGWGGLTGARWRALVRAARDELRREEAAA